MRAIGHATIADYNIADALPKISVYPTIDFSNHILDRGIHPRLKSFSPRRCAMAMYEQAESSLIDARQSWADLLKHQRVFVHCDDGALGEGYSDAVAILFARRWDEFGSFAALSKKYPNFQRWAIRHIDETASEEDLKKILLNTAACRYEVRKKRLCLTIRERAEFALKEL